MEEEKIINIVSGVLGFSMFMSCIALMSGVTAPYGRYSGTKSFGISWGCPINAKFAWFFQELPSFAVPVFFFAIGPTEITGQLTNRVLLGYFLFHYFNRTFVFPMRLRGGKPTPFGVMMAAFFFTLTNGYMQGRYLTAIKSYEDSHLQSPAFIVGSILFWGGLFINWQADGILRNLRKPGETGYKIPKGGMFTYVSGANFFGEMVEWTGFAIAAGGSIPAVTFAFCTVANIAPRAIQHHEWYLKKFEDYSALNRAAIIPFLY